MILDNAISTAYEEARLLHPAETGYFCIARAKPNAIKGRKGWTEQCLPGKYLEIAAREAAGSIDTYISQASFLVEKRAVSNTKMLRCVFVDLDLYNVGLRADEATISAIEEHARASGLPPPTYISNSGRGLYAKWVFNDSITATLLPQWRALQSVLVHLFGIFGADPKVRDAARVLRLAETINSKSDTPVTIARQSGQLHSFHELCRIASQIELPALLNISRRTKNAVQKKQGIIKEEPTDFGALANYSIKAEPIMLRTNTIQSLNWSRFLDIRDLMHKRGGIARGSRDVSLFWMTSFLAFAEVINPNNLWHEVEQLLRGFPVAPDFDPLNDNSLSSLVTRIQAHDKGEKIAYKGGTYSPIYTPTNQTLLDMLEITPDEEQLMRTIISGAEKQRRADEKVPGRAERRDERTELRTVAAGMHEQGRPISEIARELGKDRSTIHRWLSDKGVGLPYVENRGRSRAPRTVYNGRIAKFNLSARGLSLNPQHNENVSASITQAAQGTPAQPLEQKNKQRHFTSTELAKRTKTRQPKSHKQAASKWSALDLEKWLSERHARAEALRQESDFSRQRQELVDRAKEAQASLSTQVLLTELRRKAGGRDTTASISISQCQSVSSSPQTGPPRLRLPDDDPLTHKYDLRVCRH